MSVVLMRVLESAPSRYDRGIRLLTLGQVGPAYGRLAARIEPSWRVLDLGTGTGALALRAVARGAEVVALDVNAAMLAVARQKAKAAGLANHITWREIGVAELDALPDSGFDAVCSGMCFSELTPDERRYALCQAQRLLRPSGLLLLADEVRPRFSTTIAARNAASSTDRHHVAFHPDHYPRRAGPVRPGRGSGVRGDGSANSPAGLLG